VLTKRACYSAAAACVALVLFVGASASAQPYQERLFFTFSGPVELPGVVLTPGKYLFKVFDPMTTGAVVQVTSADGTRSYVFLTVPADRVSPAQEPEIRFMEATAHVPLPIRAFWNAGDVTGNEFIYPAVNAGSKPAASAPAGEMMHGAAAPKSISFWR
jgi:hypothetical protein